MKSTAFISSKSMYLDSHAMSWPNSTTAVLSAYINPYFDHIQFVSATSVLNRAKPLAASGRHDFW